MSMRWPTRCLGALILLSGMLLSAGAKPPDLPIQQKVNCKESEAPPEYGTGLVPAGAIELEETTPTQETTPAQAIDGMYPWLAEMVRACEEQVEFWFEPSAQIVEARKPLAGPCVRCSHTVVVTEAKSESCCCEGCPFCACVSEVWRICVKDFKECLAAQFGDSGNHVYESVPPQPTGSGRNIRIVPRSQGVYEILVVPPNNAASTCPYLKEQEAKQQTTPPPALPTVLENLHKLEQAEKMMRRAEKLQQEGQEVKAMLLYSDIQKLCPGSSLDGQAAVQEKACMAQVIQEIQAGEAAEPGQDKAPKVAPNCPYQQQQEAAKHAAPEKPIEPCGVLDNLNKLEQARTMLRKAERLVEAGKAAAACQVYEKVQYLCPGSRYAHVAAEKEAYLKQQERAEPGARIGEEQESTPDGEHKQSNSAKSTEEQVAELLEACQRALTEGRLQLAVELAERAIKLDAECVAANALVYKMHLLIQLQQRRELERKQLEASIEEHLELKPHLPPVDPNIVVDFERVLTESESAKPAAEEAEEQAAPPAPPFDAEDDTPGTAPDANFDENCPRVDEPPQAETPDEDNSSVFQQITSFVHRHTGIEVECSSAGARIQCEQHIAGMTFCVSAAARGIGRGLALMPTLSLPVDLHAAQRQHNEAVIEWIEGMNGR